MERVLMAVVVFSISLAGAWPVAWPCPSCCATAPNENIIETANKDAITGRFISSSSPTVVEARSFTKVAGKPVFYGKYALLQAEVSGKTLATLGGFRVLVE